MLLGLGNLPNGACMIFLGIMYNKLMFVYVCILGGVVMIDHRYYCRAF